MNAWGHRVDALSFELAYADEALAWQQQDALQRFTRERAPACVDQVLDEAQREGQVWRIERLELDLGVLPGEADDPVWAERLQAALREALAGLGMADVRTSASAGATRSAVDHQQALLMRWLREGHLAELPQATRPDALERLVQQQLAQAPQALIAALAQAPALAWRRLHRQWPTALQQALAALWPRSPSDSEVARLPGLAEAVVEPLLRSATPEALARRAHSGWPKAQPAQARAIVAPSISARPRVPVGSVVSGALRRHHGGSSAASTRAAAGRWRPLAAPPAALLHRRTGPAASDAESGLRPEINSGDQNQRSAADTPLLPQALHRPALGAASQHAKPLTRAASAAKAAARQVSLASPHRQLLRPRHNLTPYPSASATAGATQPPAPAPSSRHPSPEAGARRRVRLTQPSTALSFPRFAKTLQAARRSDPASPTQAARRDLTGAQQQLVSPRSVGLETIARHERRLPSSAIRLTTSLRARPLLASLSTAASAPVVSKGLKAHPAMRSLGPFAARATARTALPAPEESDSRPPPSSIRPCRPYRSHAVRVGAKRPAPVPAARSADAFVTGLASAAASHASPQPTRGRGSVAACIRPCVKRHGGMGFRQALRPETRAAALPVNAFSAPWRGPGGQHQPARDATAALFLPEAHDGGPTRSSIKPCRPYRAPAVRAGAKRPTPSPEARIADVLVARRSGTAATHAPPHQPRGRASVAASIRPCVKRPGGVHRLARRATAALPKPFAAQRHFHAARPAPALASRSANASAARLPGLAGRGTLARRPRKLAQHALRPSAVQRGAASPARIAEPNASLISRAPGTFSAATPDPAMRTASRLFGAAAHAHRLRAATPGAGLPRGAASKMGRRPPQAGGRRPAGSRPAPTPAEAGTPAASPWPLAVQRWLRQEAGRGPRLLAPQQSSHRPTAASRRADAFKPRRKPATLWATTTQALRQRLQTRLRAALRAEQAPGKQQLAHWRAGLALLLGEAGAPQLAQAAHWVEATLAAGVALPAPRLQLLALRLLAQQAADTAPPQDVQGAATHFAARAWAALAPQLPAATRMGTQQALWRALQGQPDDAPADATETTTLAPSGLATGERLLVADAGLVLCAPFLPRLWQRLELLDPAGRAFASLETAARAVQLLHLLASASTDTPEHLLTLPRLLCALPESCTLTRELQPSSAEREALDGLLRAMIQHWKRLGHTSPAGLRESFLRRPGQLERGESDWRLRVEPRAFDMLLDDIPWAYKTVRLPWMAEVLHVEWR